MADYNNHFELTLDTLAPEGSITRPAEFIKENANLAIVKGDATYMYVWRTASASASVVNYAAATAYTAGTFLKYVDATTKAIEYRLVNADITAAENTSWADLKAASPSKLSDIREAAAESKATNFSTSCQEYYHMILEDSVGNQSSVYNTAMITFDNEVPVIDLESAYLEDTDSGSKLFTNDPVVNFHFEASDNLSGSGVVSGRIVPVDGSMAAEVAVTPGEGGVFEGTITLTGEDGTKQVNFYATDAAGNESVSVTVSIYLDTQLAAPILTIHDAGTYAEANDISQKFINYGTAANQIWACISTEDDVVAYKFWKESETEPTSWTDFSGTSIPGTEHAVYKFIATQVTVGDGQKNFYIRVKDRAGTVYPAEGQAATTNYIKLDQTKPVISVVRKEGAAEWISNVEGHKESTIHITVSDAYAGVKSWTLKCGSSTVETGNAAVDKDVTITSATIGMVEGSNLFTLVASDDAENENTTSEGSEAVVKLDTTAPTPVSITQLNTWYNAQFSITANTADGSGSGVATIYAWTSMVAADQSCPAGATAVARTSDTQVIPAADITWALEQSAANYMHIKVVDAVGNVSYAHCQFGYDNVAPYDNGSKFDKDYYNVVTAQVNLAYGDATSGVTHMKVTGSDIDNPSTNWEAVAATRAVTLNGSDGIKTVNVQFKDAAGNVSSSVAITTELDRSAPAALHELHVAGSDAAKPAVSNIKSFDAWIAFTDDSIKTETFQYLYYGTGIGVTEAEATWKDFVPTTGKKIGDVDAMVLTGLACTDGDGLKEMYVKFKDGAGNVSEANKQSFTLDTTAPEPEAKDVDYNRISKVHILRGNGSDGKFADETKFTLDPHCMMQAYKVCAYLNQQAAKDGSHEDTPIPTTAGSQNMSGSGLHTEATVACMIKGADYETALGGAGKDGAHIVVVYVQDEGGNWSAAATFSI